MGRDFPAPFRRCLSALAYGYRDDRTEEHGYQATPLWRRLSDVHSHGDDDGDSREVGIEPFQCAGA
jgi:hypothetical protein